MYNYCSNDRCVCILVTLGVPNHKTLSAFVWFFLLYYTAVFLVKTNAACIFDKIRPKIHRTILGIEAFECNIN